MSDAYPVPKWTMVLTQMILLLTCIAWVKARNFTDNQCKGLWLQWTASDGCYLFSPGVKLSSKLRCMYVRGFQIKLCMRMKVWSRNLRKYWSISEVCCCPDECHELCILDHTVKISSMWDLSTSIHFKCICMCSYEVWNPSSHDWVSASRRVFFCICRIQSAGWHCLPWARGNQLLEHHLFPPYYFLPK